jgi:hypothetical protein
MAPVPKKPHPTKVTTKKLILKHATPVGYKAPKKTPAPVKKAQQKTKMTAKQYAAYLSYIKKHHYGIYSKNPKKAIRPDDAEMQFPAKPYWVLGENDTLETCAMTALANQLLMDERVRTPDAEITAAGEALSLTDAVERCRDVGLAGWVLKEGFSVRPDFRSLMIGGMVLGVDTPWGPHAIVTAGGGLAVSWGRLIRIRPLFRVTEAWYLDWVKREGAEVGGTRVSTVGT